MSNSGRVCNYSNCFEILNNKLILLSCGYWDDSLVINSFDETQYSPLYGHYDIVTCLAISQNEDYVVTGSKDTTVISWEICKNDPINIIKTESKRIYYGHDDEVTAIAIDSSNDIIVSGSKDGSCIIYTLHEAKFLHSFKPFEQVTDSVISIKTIKITTQSEILVYAIDFTKVRINIYIYI